MTDRLDPARRPDVCSDDLAPDAPGPRVPVPSATSLSAVYTVRLAPSSAALHRLMNVLHRARIDVSGLLFDGHSALVRIADEGSSRRFAELVSRDTLVLGVEPGPVDFDSRTLVDSSSAALAAPDPKAET